MVDAVLKNVPGGVTAPKGFSASSTACGLKPDSRKDLALLCSALPAQWGGVLTANRMPAAPVVLTRALLNRHRPLQAVVVNSGNANAGTGQEGRARAEQVIAAAARLLDLQTEQVVMASTGVIGRPLPVRKIVRALPGLVRKLSPRGGEEAAEAIMTTDTFRKEVALELDLGRKGRIRIGGMCKGAGMIHPRLATMLAFITTDATLRASRLRELLRGAAERTFNRISVDGDCSTNDTVLLMANGAAGVAIPERGKMFQRFRDGLTEVCRHLAEMIVKDGEGATKFVTVEVSGARNGREAHLAAVAVADSTLVKTSWFGQDLNWGRMVAAVGYSGAKVDPDRISIFLNGLAVVDNGTAVPDRYFARAAREMRRRELHFLIDLRIGRGWDRVLTCDLSEEYVRRNARYTS